MTVPGTSILLIMVLRLTSWIFSRYSAFKEQGCDPAGPLFLASGSNSLPSQSHLNQTENFFFQYHLHFSSPDIIICLIAILNLISFLLAHYQLHHLWSLFINLLFCKLPVLFNCNKDTTSHPRCSQILWCVRYTYLCKTKY